MLRYQHPRLCATGLGSESPVSYLLYRDLDSELTRTARLTPRGWSGRILTRLCHRISGTKKVWWLPRVHSRISRIGALGNLDVRLSISSHCTWRLADACRRASLGLTRLCLNQATSAVAAHYCHFSCKVQIQNQLRTRTQEKYVHCQCSIHVR